MSDTKDFNFKAFDFGGQARVPLIEENLMINTRTPWVYYGVSNLAPQELIRLYNSSPTHRTCIMTKWYGVRGEKLFFEEELQNQRLIMVNSLGDTLYDVWNKACLDFILYGAFALNCVWRKDREQGFELYAMDTSKLRAEKSDLHDRIDSYYYSADWAYPKKFVPRKLPAFNPSHEEPSQVFYYRNHTPGQMYYGMPSYWGAATAISTQVEIQNWHFNNIVNGVSPNMFIALNSGVPGPEEREEIYNQIMNKFGGSNSAGKIFLTFSNNKEEAPEISAIPSNASDKMWIELNEMVTESILQSHQISSPELIGILSTISGLGVSDHLESQDHFHNLVVKPIQEEIMTVFNKLLTLRDGGIPTDIKIEQYNMVTIPDEKPIETVNVNKTEGLDINKDETIEQK